MKNIEKKKILEKLLSLNTESVKVYYDAFYAINNISEYEINYISYMNTAPINCDEELKRLKNADYNLSLALFTMILREDYFSNGSFKQRYRNGDVVSIIEKIIELIS